MIRLILVLSLYLLSLFGFSQNNDQGFKLTAIVGNVVSDKGHVRFALYDSEANYLSKKPKATAIATIQDNVSKVVFDQISPGAYAIIYFHDANDNGKMDFQDNGLPLEDYGLTNNVMHFGPPQFKDGKFEVTNTDLSLEIKF